MRKSSPKKRLILPDPKFNEQVVTKFVNNMMERGKKNCAYDIFYDAIEIVTEKLKEDGLEVWKKALANVTPNVEVRSRRIGGATFQIGCYGEVCKSLIGMRFGLGACKLE